MQCRHLCETMSITVGYNRESTNNFDLSIYVIFLLFMSSSHLSLLQMILRVNLISIQRKMFIKSSIISTKGIISLRYYLLVTILRKIII